MANWTPTNPSVWLDPRQSGTLTIDTGKVVEWISRDVGVNSFYPPTGDEPGVTTLNSVTIPLFNGSSHHMANLLAINVAETATVGFVITRPSSGIISVPMGGVPGWLDYGLPFPFFVGTDNLPKVGMGEAVTSHGSTTVTTGVLIVVVSRKNGEITVRINGTPYGTAQTAPSTSSLGYDFLGKTYDSVNGDVFHQGGIAEFVVCNHTEDEEKFEGYLAHGWGQTALLPSGHPYKTVVPQADAVAGIEITYANPETSSPVTYEIREFINPSYYKYASFAIARGRYWSFLVALKSSQTQDIDIALIEPTQLTTEPVAVYRCSSITGLFTAITNPQLLVQERLYCNCAVAFRGTASGQAKGYIKGFCYQTAYGTDSLKLVGTGTLGWFTDTNYNQTSSEQARYFDDYASYDRIGLLVCAAKSTSTSNWRIIARSFYFNDSKGDVSTYNIVSVTADGSVVENAPLLIEPIRGTANFLVVYETGMRIINCASTNSLSVGAEFTHGIYDDGAFQLAYDAANNKGVLWNSTSYQTFSISGTTISSVATGSIPVGLDDVQVQQYTNSTIQFIGNSSVSPAGFAAVTILPSGAPAGFRPINTTLYQGSHVYYEDTNGAAAPPSFGLVATDGADRLYIRMFGLTGAPETPGYFDIDLPVWTAQIEGTNNGTVGDFDARLPWLSVEFSGTNFMLGSFDVSTSRLTARLNGGGSFGATIPVIAVSFSGAVHHYGSMDVGLPRITASLSGQVDAFSEISARLPILRVEINGAGPEYSGYFAVDCPVMSARFHGANDIAGEFFIDLPSFSAGITGQKQQVSGNPLAFSRDSDASSGTVAVLDQNNILQFER